MLFCYFCSPQNSSYTSESSSFGRARPCQGRGGQFEPGLPLQKQMSYNGYYSFLPSRRRRFDSSHLLNHYSKNNDMVRDLFSQTQYLKLSSQSTGLALLPDDVMVSITDFDSVRIGSSPVRVTKQIKKGYVSYLLCALCFVLFLPID